MQLNSKSLAATEFQRDMNRNRQFRIARFNPAPVDAKALQSIGDPENQVEILVCFVSGQR